VEAQLNPLSEELSRLQNETILTEKDLLRNESTRLASKIAMEIFEKMGEETNDILVSLATEIASSSGSIFSKKRGILINNLNGDIEMEDESGVMRHIDHLSLGTKDSFYIAAKLALCERKDPDLKLFILDEPFLSLDENRGDQALEVLKSYVKNKDWQIIFLSKEEELGKKLKSLFPNDFNRINL
jgi:DNA repair exonuclease SbcCD ATPase subunit